jgi:hypothetical protein
MRQTDQSILVTTIEGSVMFSVNKTQNWLKEKSDSDKSQLIAKARLESKNISEIEKKNKQQLAQDRSEILQERIKNKTESDERKQEKKNEVLKNITEIGIWQNINEITSELALLKTIKEKKLGLKKQINIHKETVTSIAGVVIFGQKRSF